MDCHGDLAQTRIWRFLGLKLYVIWDAGRLTVTRPFSSHALISGLGLFSRAYRQVSKSREEAFASLLKLRKLIRILCPKII